MSNKLQLFICCYQKFLFYCFSLYFRSFGYGFVEFNTNEGQTRALSENYMIKGRTVYLKPAVDRLNPGQEEEEMGD